MPVLPCCREPEHGCSLRQTSGSWRTRKGAHERGSESSKAAGLGEMRARGCGK